MAERSEEPEADIAAKAPSGTDGIWAAMTAALRRRRGGARDDPEFDAFLRDQRRLINLQTEHLHEQRLLILSRLRLGRWKDRITLALQAITALAGAAVVAAIGAMAWQAHQDHGVVIEAFSVPPDLAQRGLTGQVVASELQDRLSELQARTVSARPATSYASDWGDDIKVEIPETGVSIGELNRYLRQWLGDETRISGEVVRAPQGLAVIARVSRTPGRRSEGAEADLDGLIAKAAEAVYAETQPYRYAVYLQSVGRTAEAQRQYAWLAASGSAEDRPWALAGWGSLLRNQGDPRRAAEKGREAIRAAPGLGAAYVVAYTSEIFQSHREAALAIARQAGRRLRGGDAELSPGNLLVSEDLGDYRAVLASLPREVGGALEGTATISQANVALEMAEDHDVSGARTLLRQAPNSVVEVLDRFELDDWPGVVAIWESGSVAARERVFIARQAEVAYAMLGRFRDAQAIVATTPPDCDDCLMDRGIIAAAEHDWPEADRWFGEVTRRAPSSPFAPTEWGRALLAKGDLDGAIAKLKEAHRRGPQYADPLELWGEALMRKADFNGAIAKFAEADKDAPRWGGNRLRWGEALMLSRHYAQARAQYEAANGLDLSKPDRAALNVLLARTASGPLHG